VIPGADVSHHHPIQNWGIAAQNIRFLGAKATEGATFVDPTLGTHLAGFRASSLDLLILYHVATPGDPIAQAQFVTRTVGALQPHERLCLDLEAKQAAAGVTFDWVNRFFGELFGDGHDPLIESRPLLYASRNSCGAAGFPLSWDIAKYIDLWMPHYAGVMGPCPTSWSEPKIWQYSSTEQIPGIDCSNGGCDANWWLGSQDELTAFAV
jgi:GH25 family lysozyme M1 (1,4-beta-N-acetylmuramidase)